MEQTVKVTPVEGYDIAVCGGGIAGIAAALAAARHGKKVVLLERQYLLGGLAITGLITIYLPLCDGLGKQVSFGIAEELLKLSIKHGAEARYPKNWLDGEGTRTEKDQRYAVQYNAQLFAILAEQLLLENGVDILYGSYAVDVIKKNDKIDTLVVEGKSGRQGYKVSAVVDATGDCDIALFAGVSTDTYEKGNLLAAWYYSAEEKGYTLNKLGNADPALYNDPNTPLFPGLGDENLSEMMILAHKNILDHFLKKRETDPSAWIATLPTVPQVRMSRKIRGEYSLAEAEVHTYFEDSIGMVSDWRKRGPVFEVPFRTLYAKQVKNLIIAGRCTSVEDDMWDIMRVIPCCAVTGQAAGTAAAMTDDFTSLDVSLLQKKLEQDGVVLHEKDIPVNK